MENMQRCLRWYGPDRPVRVVDLGSAAVNGSYRELFGDKTEYIGLDLESGPGVDMVLADPYRLPFADASIDLVVSGQMLEHCPNFWRVFTEISRVLKTEGLAFIIAPSAGPIHRYPVDCYRFYPDSYEALADWANLRVVDSWLDERGPWRDLVGVFQKGGSMERMTMPPKSEYHHVDCNPSSDEAAEAKVGVESYLSTLGRIHKILEPKLYVEIGIRKGNSIRLSNCETIGIDPNEEFVDKITKFSFYNCTSDDFFFFYANEVIKKPIDLIFIDGMHLAEYVYRDFMNAEKYMRRTGVVVIDDVLPNHPLQAARIRQTQVWSGDVWRFVRLLSEVRPDLQLTWLNTAPTGLLVVRGLDPANTVLRDQYNPLIRRLLEDSPTTPPQSLLRREGAIVPTDDGIRAALGLD